MDLREYIAPDLLEKFEFYSYNHALEIITQAFPAEWSEIVECLRQLGRFSQEPFEEKVIPGYIDGHNIDFLKNRIAFDLEWNSKDQTFDRDLLAMRTYYDCDLVSAGIIITRSAELHDIFKTIYDYDGKTRQWKPILRKYGASTTWMGKLTYRLDSRRNGGCPILAVGIRKPCITDWEEGYIDEHNPGNI